MQCQISLSEEKQGADLTLKETVVSVLAATRRFPGGPSRILLHEMHRQMSQLPQFAPEKHTPRPFLFEHLSSSSTQIATCLSRPVCHTASMGQGEQL